MSDNLFVPAPGEDYREHEAVLLQFLAEQAHDFNSDAWQAFAAFRRDAGFMAVFVSSVLLSTRPTVSDRFYKVAEELLGGDLTAEGFGRWLGEAKLQAPRLSQSLLHALEAPAG